MINVNESLALISSLPALNKVETVTLNASLGRVLAQNIIADTDLPPFNKSAMDGYACRQNDLPGPLIIRGEIAAGTFTGNKLETGNCYRIFTGAPVPDGADCVIMQEYTEQDSKGNVIFTQPSSKNNICCQGEDMKVGQVAIKAGVIIQPQHLAVMAGFGIIHPRVACKPRVAIICSGSELVEPSIKPEKAMIRNSNAYHLIGQVAASGAEPEYLGIVADNKELISNTIKNILGKYDLLIVTGGASVGDYDFMPGILISLGAQLHFSALNIQPGKPVLFATLGNTHVLGLSGNPVSSFLQFLLVAKPLLYRLTGCTISPLKTIKMPLAETIKRKKGNRQLYVPVTFQSTGFANPVPFNGSGHITALCGIDGFAIMDTEINEMMEKQPVNVLLL